MKRTTTLLFSVLMLALPSTVFAAHLSVFPASISLNKGDSVGFIVRLQSDDSINTVGAALKLPPNLAFLSASDGKVITQWVEHPAYDPSAKEVSFAGIIPGGWNGDGQLAVITVAAKESGVYSLSYDESQTEIYKNDGNATPEPVVYGVAPVALVTAHNLLWVGLALLVLIGIYFVVRRKFRIQFR